mgnify:CR=1 FL=1
MPGVISITGCAHLLDEGWSEPRCADACPTNCLQLLDEDEAQELIAKGQVWRPELKDQEVRGPRHTEVDINLGDIPLV